MDSGENDLYNDNEYNDDDFNDHTEWKHNEAVDLTAALEFSLVSFKRHCAV